MLKILRLRVVWERLAREDPFWAVLTAPEKKDHRWQIDSFFQTGDQEVEASLAAIERHVPGLPRNRGLDFGCGVGRLSQALGHHFQEVVGVDVAARMIALANRLNRAPGRVKFVHNPRNNLKRFPGDHFDLVLSLITLQHIPPELIEIYVAEFIRVIRPGGVAFFQIPTFVPRAQLEVKQWSFRPATMKRRFERWFMRWFRNTTGVGASMSMHALPESRVREILAGCGAELTATFDHPIPGRYKSQIYLARKTRPGPVSPDHPPAS